GLCLGEEGALWLTGDQRSPAVAEKPPHLGERANLLTAVTAGRLGVQDGRHAGRLPPVRFERENSIYVAYEATLPAPAASPAATGPRPRPAPPPPPKPPRPPPPPPRRSPPPEPGAFAFST